MTQFVRMVIATGQVEPETLRDGVPVLLSPDAPQPTLECKGWRWLEVVPNNLAVWQTEAGFPETVEGNATTIARSVSSVSLADWKAKRKRDINDHAYQRIVGVTPIYSQLNSVAAAVRIIQKQATGDQITPEEQLELVHMASVWDQLIDPVRAATNAAVVAIMAAQNHQGVEDAFNAMEWP